MESKEIWKYIEDYNDYYISNMGRVKSFKRYKNGKILKQIKDRKGYYYINLYKNKEHNHEYIHILVFENFNNYKLNNDECCHHIDENKINNKINNLKKMSKSNHRSLHISGKKHHFYKKKRPEFSGENHPNSILTKSKINEIKRLNLPLRKIAKIFGISHTTVWNIKTGKTWNHV